MSLNTSASRGESLPLSGSSAAAGDVVSVASEQDQDLATRVGHLFKTVVHPATGEPYTNAEVVRMSAGGLTEEEVAGIRTGAVPNPTAGQVAALAAVFGVEPSYLVDRKEPPSLDAELLEGLSDETTRQITREALRLLESERRIVLGIVRQFGETRSVPGGRQRLIQPPEGGLTAPQRSPIPEQRLVGMLMDEAKMSSRKRPRRSRSRY